MVLVQLKSEDVLHSFFLPNMRVKQDAVPGMRIPVWFRPMKIGRYDLPLRRAVRLGTLQDEGPADGRIAKTITRPGSNNWQKSNSPRCRRRRRKLRPSKQSKLAR